MLCVIANFGLGNVVFAKNIAKINDKDVKKIKTGLDLVKTVVNFTIRDDKLKTILNTGINIGDTSTDITYGLLVLSTLNEMEFIDLVVSQKYKTVAKNYFNSILDERLNLMNYYTGIGYDLPRILSGNITGPMSALTLNAFSMTSKVIKIFIAIENLKTVKSYNGLWYYFDLRKSNESHKTAWEEAKIVMGWATKPLFSLRDVNKITEDNKSQLELQFATLFDKWGPYVTINKGVNEQYKKQVQKELQNTVVTAYESYKFVEKEDKPFFTEKARTTLNNLLEKISKIPVFVANTGKNIQKTAQEQLNKISSQIQRLTAFISNFGTGMAVKVEEISEQLIEPEIKNIEEKASWDKLSLSQKDELSVVSEAQDMEYKGGPEPSLDKLSLSKEEIQEIIDDISERVDVLAQEVKELMDKEVRVKEEFKEEIGKEQEETFQAEKQELADGQESNESIVYYSGGISYSPPNPVFLKILITEIQIASENNQKDDFVELYNPNSEDVNLTDWYIQRKTKSASDFSTYAPKSLFSGKLIRSHNYFLIANASSSPFVVAWVADVLTTYPLTEDNTLVLKNPNREISDKVGWGQSQDFETAPIENPLVGESIGRKWSATSESYIDTDNNSQDFEIQEPTPRAQNKSKIESEPESESENQLPIASFSYNPQNPKINEQIVFDASPSTDSDGQITSFIWDFGDGNSSTTNQATTSHFFTTSSDFIVSFKVIDNLGATSSLATTTISVSEEQIFDYPIVVINEISWMGTASSSNDEWIELYNNTEQDIDMANWTLSWSHGTTSHSIVFSTSTATTTISAYGFYLMERTNNDTISDIFADKIYTGTLNNNGEHLKLFDNQDNLIDEVNYVDNWFAGENQKIGDDWLRVSMERINSTSTGSTSTNWLSNNLIVKNGKDVSGNNINGTPRALNSASISPTLITNLLFDKGISEIILTLHNSPYLVQDNLDIPQNKALSIEQGVIIKFCEECELIVEGVIQTPAISTQDIVFTSWRDDDYGGDTNGDGQLTKGEEGDWRRIYFKDSFGSELNNVIVKYGGKFLEHPSYTNSSYLPIIHVEGGSISIQNATISDAFTRAIWLDNSTSTISDVVLFNIKNSPSTRDSAAIFITNGNSVIENSTFLDNSIGVEIQDSISTIKNSTFSNNSTGIEIKAGEPNIENNTFENNEVPIRLFGSASPNFLNNYQNTYNNDLNAVFLATSTSISATSTWQADLPYVINTNISISQGVSLTLEPNVVIKFGNKKLMLINGKLIAQGASDSEVIFTSLKDDDYGGDTNNDATSTHPYDINPLDGLRDWFGLRFYSSGSILDGVIIRYGGTTFDKAIGAVAIEENVDITIQNSIIEKNRLAITYEGANCTTTKQKIEQLETKNNVVFSDDNAYKYLVSDKCYWISSTEHKP
ncbi:MAG: lamin tail domain-containing protein [Patescibacteria group bacterium]|nr:lamin tail domain-containing protein [Patescibacteria group bacterium]